MYVSCMETRQRGNPSGNTNEHVAANVRTARQAIGMDLRSFAELLKATGRTMSASGLSKIENGDRRVDVDDLTAVSSIHYYENLMKQYAGADKGNQIHRGTYEERLASFRARRDAARVRLIALDPDALPAPRDDTADGWA